MEASTLSEKRLLVGILSVVCLVLSAILWIFGTDPQNSPLVGSLVRVGVVLGALWFALPRKGESVVWSKALFPGVAIVVAMAFLRRAAWWILPLAVVVGIALVLLRPKPKPKR